MRKPKKVTNLYLSFYTKDVSYQIPQIVNSYLLKLYIEPKETEFKLESVFSYISFGIFSPSGGIRLGVQKKIKFGV